MTRRITSTLISICLCMLAAMGPVSSAVALAPSAAGPALSATASVDGFDHDFGVFIGMDSSHLDELSGYRTVVIDAQGFSKDQISQLHEAGHVVYTYLNVGSIEEYRDYYADFEDLVLGDYEGWEDEHWIDVSSMRWRDYVVRLASQLRGKGVDGFFVDNCDVYAVYPRREIYYGLIDVLFNLNSRGASVIINGGDAFVSRFLAENGTLAPLCDGVCQESVFTAADPETGLLSAASEADTRFFVDYLDTIDTRFTKVYLIEYTNDADIASKIGRFCADKGWSYYLSDSIALD